LSRTIGALREKNCSVRAKLDSLSVESQDWEDLTINTITR
jgi:hypothetical protein